MKAGDWDDVPAMLGSYLEMWFGLCAEVGTRFTRQICTCTDLSVCGVDDRRSHGSADGAEFLIAVGGWEGDNETIHYQGQRRPQRNFVQTHCLACRSSEVTRTMDKTTPRNLWWKTTPQ